jgi:hypothetical protein
MVTTITSPARTELIGDRLDHPDPGQQRGVVAYGVQIRHICRGGHVDPGRQDLGHILPAPSLCVGDAMSQLIHEHQVRLGRQDCVDVEFGEDAATVGRVARGDDVDLPELRPCLATTVTFDPADDDALPGIGPSLTLGQRAVALADSGRRAQVGP